MSEGIISNIRINSIVTAVPIQKDFTSDYPHFTKEEKVQFENRIGIIEKRNSGGLLTTSDLCFEAALKVFELTNWEKDEIEILIFVSQTGDFVLPPTSLILQDRLGLNTNTYLLDLNLGCTGWINGLITITSIMKSMNFKKGLLLCGETNILSEFKDKSTYPLMGDAGTASAIEFQNLTDEILFEYKNYGFLYNSIIAPNSKAKHFSDIKKDLSKDKELSLKTTMNGLEVFNFAIEQVVPSLKIFFNKLAESNFQIDYVIFHQANKMIIETLRKKLGILPNRCLNSISHFGNTSSASIPLTICLNNQNEELLNKSLLCVSFGVGMSIANMYYKISENLLTEIIEVS